MALTSRYSPQRVRAAKTLAVLTALVVPYVAFTAATGPVEGPVAAASAEPASVHVPGPRTSPLRRAVTTRPTPTPTTTTSTTTTQAPTPIAESKPAPELSGTALLVWEAFADVSAAEANNAVTIAFCESSLKAWKVNANKTSKDYGLFQLNDAGTLQTLFEDLVGYYPNEQQAVDAAMWVTWNIKAARALFDQRGWAPWACGVKTGVTDGLWSRKPGLNWGTGPYMG